MSDINIFDGNAVFTIGLVLFSPLGVLLLLGFFFKSIEKPRTAKIFYSLAVIYGIFIFAALLYLNLT
ncbi:hypothetical protein [Cellulophaga tyrosinoxydans]|nr:hypothetical protein [Cellulophaga tyrosinoxydans]